MGYCWGIGIILWLHSNHALIAEQGRGGKGARLRCSAPARKARKPRPLGGAHTPRANLHQVRGVKCEKIMEVAKMAEKRSRLFGLVTYISDTARIVEMIGNKRNSVRAYALIKHDKDAADLHHHIVIRTHSAWSCSAISKWFKDTETGQNTFAEFVHDAEGIIDYLTHENEVGKYHYSKDEIIDGGLTDLLPRADTCDSSFDIIEEMLSGVSTRELCKRYGREFIYRYASYRAVVEQIKEEEN